MARLASSRVRRGQDLGNDGIALLFQFGGMPIQFRGTELRSIHFRFFPSIFAVTRL